MRATQTLDNWKKRLAGEQIQTHDGDPNVGFYRLRKKDAATNEVWWTPAAYFIDDGQLVGVIGDRNMNDREVTELWTYVCGNPIPEEVFFAFDGRVEVPNAEWPKGLLGEPKRPPFANKDDAFLIPTRTVTRAELEETFPAANREVARSDNAEPEVPLHEQHKAAIEAAIGAAPKAVPTTAEECALVEGSKNRIAELRLKADKAGKVIYEPIFRTYKAEQEQWSPVINAATTAEKALGQLALRFRENERQRIAKEAAEAAAKQREIDEANARAADRAIAAGKPEPAPMVAEVAAPTIAPVAPTYGKRTTKAELKIILDEVTDFDALYQYFKNTDEVKAALTVLARVAVAAGRTVPGTKTREGLI